MDDVMAETVSDVELQGYVVAARTLCRAKPCTFYYVVQFSKPFKSFSGWRGKDMLGKIDKISGKNCGVLVEFSTKQDEVILMKVALSYVSIAQARLNLNTKFYRETTTILDLTVSF